MLALSPGLAEREREIGGSRKGEKGKKVSIVLRLNMTCVNEAEFSSATEREEIMLEERQILNREKLGVNGTTSFANNMTHACKNAC